MKDCFCFLSSLSVPHKTPVYLRNLPRIAFDALLLKSLKKYPIFMWVKKVVFKQTCACYIYQGMNVVAAVFLYVFLNLLWRRDSFCDALNELNAKFIQEM